MVTTLMSSGSKVQRRAQPCNGTFGTSAGGAPRVLLAAVADGKALPASVIGRQSDTDPQAGRYDGLGGAPRGQAIRRMGHKPPSLSAFQPMRIQPVADES